MTTTTAAFDAVISAWDQAPQCEPIGRELCSHTATRRVSMHGCRCRLMCLDHARLYVAETLAALGRKSLRCTFCKQPITTVLEAVEVTLL